MTGAMRVDGKALSAAALAMLLLAGPLPAQGNLSTQGFGYPLGQLGSRALSMGGGNGEVDPQSALNPAMPMLWGAAVLFGQYDPEFRNVRTPAGRSRTMTARFPGIGASFPIGQRLAAAIGVTTYLDRTWATVSERPQVVGPDTVAAMHQQRSDGSINDVRLAVAYAVTPHVSVGVGGHLFTGENRFLSTIAFPDTVRFSAISERHDLSYSGVAASAGIEARIGRHWQVGGSFRQGGRITAEAGDTAVARADIPLRAGASLSYAGIQGTTLHARAAYEEWSSLRPLGSPNLAAFDGWDFGVGAEVTGPRLGRRIVMLRAGGRHRTLPFGAAGEKVDELTIATGLGIPVAIDRAVFDFALLRASRRAQSAPSGNFGNNQTGDVRETGYILSFGLRVRP